MGGGSQLFEVLEKGKSKCKGPEAGISVPETGRLYLHESRAFSARTAKRTVPYRKWFEWCVLSSLKFGTILGAQGRRHCR